MALALGGLAAPTAGLVEALSASIEEKHRKQNAHKQHLQRQHSGHGGLQATGSPMSHKSPSSPISPLSPGGAPQRRGTMQKALAAKRRRSASLACSGGDGSDRRALSIGLAGRDGHPALQPLEFVSRR